MPMFEDVSPPDSDYWVVNIVLASDSRGEGVHNSFD